jgi:hypothetical protein
VKTAIGFAKATTVEELIEALQDLCDPSQRTVTYVTINSDSIKLVLVEELLTDGSEVYNVELSEATKS